MKFGVVLGVLLIGLSAIAQDPPRRPGPGGGPGQGPGPGPGPGAPEFGNVPAYNTRPGDRERDRERSMGERPPGDRPHPLMVQIEHMRGWLDVVDRYARMSRDPVASGVAAVIAADDLLKRRGPEQAIEYFTKLVGEVKNEAVQRAIRLQLVELYGKSNQADKALEQLRMLIIATPEGAGGPPSGGPGGGGPGGPGGGGPEGRPRPGQE